MEYIIAAILILITVYFIFFKKSKPEVTPVTSNESKKPQAINLDNKKNIELEEKVQTTNLNDYLVNSFRELKSMQCCHSTVNGKVIYGCDDRKMIVILLDNPSQKSPKILSKSIDHDSLCDIAFSAKNNLIVAALKNSKELLFFTIKNDENNKLKILKTDKIIKTTRKGDIKQVVISNCGNYVATSGQLQDTNIEFYNTNTQELMKIIDLNEIQNVDMKITNDDKFLIVSTFMYELSVIEFIRTSRFNKAIDGDEITLKLERKQSVRGIKVPIIEYNFSMDGRFFIVSLENSKVKIFHNPGNIESSSVYSEITFSNNVKPTRLDLFVSDYVMGKLHGLIAFSERENLYLSDLDGKVVLTLKHAHDTDINLIKLVKGENDLVYCISGSRDGKFHVWKYNLN